MPQRLGASASPPPSSGTPPTPTAKWRSISASTASFRPPAAPTHRKFTTPTKTCCFLREIVDLYVFVQICLFVRFRTNNSSCTFSYNLLFLGRICHGRQTLCGINRRCCRFHFAARLSQAPRCDACPCFQTSPAPQPDPSSLLRYRRRRISNCLRKSARVAPAHPGFAHSLAAAFPAHWGRYWTHLGPHRAPGQPLGR